MFCPQTSSWRQAVDKTIRAQSHIFGEHPEFPPTCRAQSLPAEPFGAKFQGAPQEKCRQPEVQRPRVPGEPVSKVGGERAEPSWQGHRLARACAASHQSQRQRCPARREFRSSPLQRLVMGRHVLPSRTFERAPRDVPRQSRGPARCVGPRCESRLRSASRGRKRRPPPFSFRACSWMPGPSLCTDTCRPGCADFIPLAWQKLGPSRPPSRRPSSSSAAFSFRSSIGAQAWASFASTRDCTKAPGRGVWKWQGHLCV